ncbi:hypothetical protein CRU98_11295 [Arcobacter sp. CECT 8986]|uniref:hypothetical protein n=1 Tax=Arcobacter sp. CECT 8986 TaxID=2044507 RepID=UPI001009C3FE|nr:hypothetical protein [Arcobacter sp. CECT 8986]RXJ98095.1 hypothetical protein CRU98_11295 [Arcobacter sp. CECT 8986]
MRGVKDGKKFEQDYIGENGKSKKIEINKIDSNGYNTFCKDSYLNSKYYMKKVYKNKIIVDTKTDDHKKGIGQGKLMSVEIIGTKE